MPAQWRGGLPITYRFGPGAARVHLKLKFDFGLKPLYDVIARLPGTTEADQWVIRGNHHDAWVNGAEDPISGQVAELEEARALGELYKQGWRPKRTIIYASWDGEEPGLLGSTEWAEAHADSLAAHAVAYLNSDTNGRGYLGVEGSHSLESFINGVEKDIIDPESNVSSWKRNQAALVMRGNAEARAGGDLRIGALGSGSDFTPFLQHLGIASINVGYGGEDDGGIYHSIYDDFYWYTHFSDTTFVYGRALAQAVGTTVMRLADADVLPFVFTNLAATTHRYVDELQQLRDARAKEIDEERQRATDSVYAIVRDPRAPVGVTASAHAAAALRLCSAARRTGLALRGGDTVREGVRGVARRRRRGTGRGSSGGRWGSGPLCREPSADASRAGAHAPRGPQEPAVVQALALRAGLLHGLWREDDAGDS